MSFIKKYKNTIIGIVIALLAFFLLDQCHQTRQIKLSKKSAVSYLTDSIKHLKQKNGEIIAQRNALRGTEEDLKILLSNTSDKLKRLTERFNRVNTAVEIKTVTEIDTLYMPYENPVDYNFKRGWGKETEYYKITGVSSNEGVMLNSLSLTDTISLVIGERKNSYVIELKNSNPYINTQGVDAYTIMKDRKRFGLGLFIGGGITKDFKFTPVLGVGLTYDIIRF